MQPFGWSRVALSRTRHPRSPACLSEPNPTGGLAGQVPETSAAQVPTARERPWPGAFPSTRPRGGDGLSCPPRSRPLGPRASLLYTGSARGATCLLPGCPSQALCPAGAVPLAAGEALPGLGAGHLCAPVLPAHPVGPCGGALPAARPVQREDVGPAAGQMPKAAGRQGLLSTGPGWREACLCHSRGSTNTRMLGPEGPWSLFPTLSCPPDPLTAPPDSHVSPRSSPNGPSPLSASWALWPAVLHGALGEAVH